MVHPLLKQLVRKCRLVRLRIEGFKSLRDLEVEFSTPLTVVVGAKGSGRTALVEAIELLRAFSSIVEAA